MRRRLTVGGTALSALVKGNVVTIEGRGTTVTRREVADGVWLVIADGAVHLALMDRRNGLLHVDGSNVRVESNHAASSAAASQSGLTRADIPGLVVELRVSVGDAVESGDTLCVVEAMKMRNDVKSVASGAVKALFVAAGDAVAAGDKIALVENA